MIDLLIGAHGGGSADLGSSVGALIVLLLFGFIALLAFISGPDDVPRSPETKDSEEIDDKHGH